MIQAGGQKGGRRRRAGARALRAAALAAALALGLAGCGGGPPPQTFDLAALPPGGATGRLRGQLIVTEPVATQALDSERIVVRPTPESVAYLTGAQWSDRLPKLIQTRIVQSLENARLLRSVGRPGDRIAADFLLDAELRRFEIEASGGEAAVEITVKLVAAGSGRIVAADVVSARAGLGVERAG
ncbi:MAG: membrane integrity-associated transporter subunit PqiC, partial [Methylobacteriaceae bacterium]|nr:membrane integrity-associated transporter subunit PqiC [Methylobacteriaceae bacterium]